MGPGGGETLVDGTTLGMGARGSGTSGARDSFRIPGLATPVGSGTDLRVVEVSNY